LHQPTIEIGCGEGEHFFSIFLDIIENEYIGIDIADNAVSRALDRRNVLRNVNAKIDFLQGDFQSAVDAVGNLNSDTVNILILEALYYLSDDEILEFFKSLVATNKEITLIISSLNVKELKGREYLTLMKIQKLISHVEGISLNGCYPITMKKKSFLFPIWFTFAALRNGNLDKNISLLCRSSAARNNLYMLKVNGN
jgi:SAM-dependent methyltransferase